MDVVARKSIVVVNDSRPSLGLVADALERDGYAVVPCAETARAHAVIRGTMPDLIVLDSRGAAATNWHASAMLKLEAQTSAIPVLLCFPETPEHMAVAARGRAMGCRVLVEPFEPHEFLAGVHDLLDEPARREGAAPRR